ncbi:hypothetical protein [Marasmitruncus massiliensis]|uniref:hypothetical protein n=1 Tax=Marasmitruncus massiliensis TaxID=1944642 RepID=UPI0015E07384|nr:hypothetical protein [Marasmitruncus massiliensis]
MFAKKLKQENESLRMQVRELQDKLNRAGQSGLTRDQQLDNLFSYNGKPQKERTDED